MQPKQTKAKTTTKQSKIDDTEVQTQRRTGKSAKTRPNGVGNNTGRKTKTTRATGRTGRKTGLETGKEGNKRQGAAAGPDIAAGEAATEHTGLPREAVTKVTGRLGGTGPRTAAELTGLDVTAEETATEPLDLAGKKQGEDETAKSRRGRDQNGRRGKQSDSQAGS